jgi:hypothetical protein
MSRDVKIPDDIGEAAEKAAQATDMTIDELVTEALKRYLAHQKLEELSSYGAEHMRELGLDNLSEDAQMEYVNRSIKESRSKNRSR